MAGQFIYTLLVITGSPTCVEIDKSSDRVSRLTPKFTTIHGVAKDSVASESNDA